MNIDNITMVRATNIIPYDGVVSPLSNVPYLCKNIGLEFSARISDLLHELGVIPPIDQSKMFEKNYYITMFLSNFLMYFNAPEDMINNISKNIHYKPFLLKVMTLIKELGIDKYKQFVDSYNKKLEEQQKNMTLITPEDIISFNKEIKHKI